MWGGRWDKERKSVVETIGTGWEIEFGQFGGRGKSKKKKKEVAKMRNRK